MIGLPGTGLGGIFYALLIVWMPLREAWLRRAGGWKRRGRPMARLASLLAAIVAALWAEGWLLVALFEEALTIKWAGHVGRAEATVVSTLAPALAIAPFVVLVTLLCAVHAARIVIGHSRA